MNELKIFAEPEAVAQAAAEYLFEKINHCIEKHGICHVVLPGGSTPARCLELLAEKPLQWQHIHWYPGDERCYPPGHDERNDTMIMDKLFARNDNVSHEASQTFHPVPAEQGASNGAKIYAEFLHETLQNSNGNFDIVVLGMGEDGHTASLFPGNPALDDTHDAVAVFNAPKASDERVSISLQRLKNAATCMVITTGEGKYEALAKIKQGEKLPIAMVEPDIWFVDEAAVNQPFSE